MTRSAPAKLLGLSQVGTLEPGALADVVVYRDDENRERMFSSPRMSLRRGQPVRIGQGESTANDWSQVRKVTHTIRPEFDPRSLPKLAAMHAEESSFLMERLAISDDEMASRIGSEPLVHACRTRNDEAAIR